MSYLVLARKYRPRTFKELVGQSQVTGSLTSALRTGRVAHAYLFTGPRGVGKTTAARLLAMALSCEAELEARPCGSCHSCLSIQNGNLIDLIEVDGASNNGIEQIRKLRETVNFQPAKSRYKVYIIDEVHALSMAAFNALLKTLEEPPGHVVFIFATTEAHKLPATILSRCQRYDFRRIRMEDMVARLETVAKAENIECNPEGLMILAREAEGGLRDALGLLDQVIATAGKVTEKTVRDSLGLVSPRLVEDLAEAALASQVETALALLSEAYARGSDIKELSLRALEFVRDLTLYKAGAGVSELLQLTDAEESRLSTLSAAYSLPALHRHFESWLKLAGEISRHPHPRWLLESHLLRLCHAAPLENLAELTARLTKSLEADPGAVRASVKILKDSASALTAAALARLEAAPPLTSADLQGETPLPFEESAAPGPRSAPPAAFEAPKAPEAAAVAAAPSPLPSPAPVQAPAQIGEAPSGPEPGVLAKSPAASSPEEPRAEETSGESLVETPAGPPDGSPAAPLFSAPGLSNETPKAPEAPVSPPPQVAAPIFPAPPDSPPAQAAEEGKGPGRKSPPPPQPEAKKRGPGRKKAGEAGKKPPAGPSGGGLFGSLLSSYPEERSDQAEKPPEPLKPPAPAESAPEAADQAPPPPPAKEGAEDEKKKSDGDDGLPSGS
ncbi:MAG: DNA polymerase III subunit gamma/tau [Deltaproteobacteria bacterium]|jgi:DNA polymerase-3 subunit gamma/tau|nr:DNA polymerase III subunit gamma/tau [Deltaproteobacteria bacterium]